MSKETEFPVGEYIDSDGDRIAVLAVDGDYRWCKYYDCGAAFTTTVDELHQTDIEPYVAPVVVKIYFYVSLGCGGKAEMSYFVKYGGHRVCFTFHDDKLVKAEVES